MKQHADMTYVLYDDWGSGYLAVEMALAEIGLDYQIRELTWRPKPSVTIVVRR
ncbi:MAG: glutathione S-transferase N-terminal domain-containing protein [Alphaproteobacteria bacterium]